MSDVRWVRCPNCGQDAAYSSSNPARPFCSERCRLIDLGAWADERYRLPVVEDDPELQDEPVMPSPVGGQQ